MDDPIDVPWTGTPASEILSKGVLPETLYERLFSDPEGVVDR